MIDAIESARYSPAVRARNSGSLSAERNDRGPCDEQRDHGNEDLAHESAAAAQRQASADQCACDVADGHCRTDRPQDVAARGEVDQCGTVRRDVENAGRGTRMQEVIAVAAHEDEHQKAAGAGTEEAVVEPDCGNRESAKQMVTAAERTR